LSKIQRHNRRVAKLLGNNIEAVCRYLERKAETCEKNGNPNRGRQLRELAAAFRRSYE
jgi:hypothetical protein